MMIVSEGKPQGFSIFHDVFIEASTQEVFKAITQPEHLINWWPLRCSGKPELDETYNFFFANEYDWFGKVSQIETDKSFYIKMTDSDQDWNPTTFGFDLELHEKGTMLHFWHQGWPKNNHHFRKSSYCWALLLNGLKNYVEKGVVISFENRA